jgi:DNA-binding transcriptional regulator YiaG
MSTLAIALKDEIRRLARKEIKIQTARTARAVTQYRREIAQLKRQHRDYEKKLAALRGKRERRETIADDDGDRDGGLRFSSRSVRAQRRRTGLSAADYAKLVGVSPLTIYNWEHNKTRPRQGQFVTLVSLRGLGKRDALARLLEHGTTNGSAKKRTRRRAK